MFWTPNYDGAGHMRYAVTASGGDGEQTCSSTTALVANNWY